MKSGFVHTDIREGFVTRHLPQSLKPYASLARIDRPVGIWLLALPGLWAIVLAAGGLFAMNAYDWEKVLLFVLGAILMRPAGCIINDLWDRDLDCRVERTKARPLAAGTLKPYQAFVFLSILLIAALTVLLQMNFITILLGFLSLPLIIAYPLMKRWTWWPQAFLGLTFNFGALMGWAAITGIVGLPALCLYFGGFFWTLGYDTVYAHQDKEDDALIGVKSSALRLGGHSRKAVYLFYSLAFLLIAAGITLAEAGWLSFLLLCLPLIFTVFVLKEWKPDDPESSLKAFQANRIIGFLILLAMI